MTRWCPVGHPGRQARLSRFLSPSALLFPSFPLSIAGCYSGTDSPVHNYAPSGRPLNDVRRVAPTFPPVWDLSEPSALRSFAYRPSYITRHRSARFPAARIYLHRGSFSLSTRYSRAWNAAGKQTNRTPISVRGRDDGAKIRDVTHPPDGKQRDARVICPRIWVSIVCGTLVMFDTSNTAEKWNAVVPSKSVPGATKWKRCTWFALRQFFTRSSWLRAAMRITK